MFRSRNKSSIAPPRKPKPLVKIGKATGTIRVYGIEKTKLRERVFHRANGFCERRLEGCMGYTPWRLGHLSHIGSSGAGHPDTEENTCWSCESCHIKSHNCDGKPIRIGKDGEERE